MWWKKMERLLFEHSYFNVFLENGSSYGVRSKIGMCGVFLIGNTSNMTDIWTTGDSSIAYAM